MLRARRQRTFDVKFTRLRRKDAAFGILHKKPRKKNEAVHSSFKFKRHEKTGAPPPGYVRLQRWGPPVIRQDSTSLRLLCEPQLPLQPDPYYVSWLPLDGSGSQSGKEVDATSFLQGTINKMWFHDACRCPSASSWLDVAAAVGQVHDAEDVLHSLMGHSLRLFGQPMPTSLHVAMTEQPRLCQALVALLWMVCRGEDARLGRVAFVAEDAATRTTVSADNAGCNGADNDTNSPMSVHLPGEQSAAVRESSDSESTSDSDSGSEVEAPVARRGSKRTRSSTNEVQARRTAARRR